MMFADTQVIYIKIKISYNINMDDTAEYERIFNMSINERRQLLKDKDQDFKKEYFAYDNRERARIRRQKNKTNEDNKDMISHDQQLNTNPALFKEKIEELFKNAKKNAEISNSNIVNEIINNPPPIQIINNPSPPPVPVQSVPQQIPQPVQSVPKNDITEPFYKDVIYADTIISKNYITDDGNDGYLNENSLNNIKNYNIKIPVEHLKDIYIKLPNNNNSSLIIDGEYAYIFFNSI